ncbi:MAG: hypothetical protein M4579_001206 [Chaenotheca gracillima]|nr:MAG: hypothetical protein M4579_001206 [Chaenotheca gracillima]
MRLNSAGAFLSASLLGVVSTAATAATTPPQRSLDQAIKDEGILEKAIEYGIKKVEQGGCKVACDLLGLILGNDVSKPNSAAFSANEGSYWAQQQSSIAPACFVTVQRPVDVSISVLLARLTTCPFAVRSGGHSDIPGASNIKDGITINLSKLNQVSVSADKKTTQVGPGATWGDVYHTLDPQGLTVIGGRESSVGVGGLTLGGGMSYFSGRYGFACDNVANYQVVLPDGLIQDVNQKSNPDLYFALRGGGNNFGIVTRFDLETYPQGQMWGGIRVYSFDTQEAITSGFEAFNKAANPDMALITSFAYAEGSYTASIIWDYSKPEADPPITKTFNLAGSEPVFDTTRITTLSNLTDELDASTPPGFRNRYTTATYKNSAKLQDKIISIFVAEFEKVKDSITNTTGLAPVVAFQPISTAISSHFSRNGGNALGVSPDDGPLMLVQYNWAWASTADDTRVTNAIESILAQAETAAQSMGLANDYVYLNYAAPNQKPFDGYGAANKNRLINIQKLLDPKGVFSILQPGYFKLI